jgi:hypothetical protein
MDDPAMDLMDRRGRLKRLGVAVAIGLAITVVVMWAIMSVSITPNKDPVAGSSVGLLAIFVFIVTTATAHSLVNRFSRRG